MKIKTFALNISALAVTGMFVLSGQSVANDSVAEIGAGGLEYVQTDKIEMVREDLYISTEIVRVDYVFHNHAEEDLTLLVAFPMPSIAASNDFDVAVPFYDDDNFMGFSVEVDGQSITPDLQQRAIVVGVDMTRELSKRGIPILNTGVSVLDALDALPESELAALESKGLIVRDQYRRDASGKMLGFPAWEMESAYYWEMVFPAQQDVHVSHAYTPAVGASAGSGLDFFDTPEDAANQQYTRKYCLDQSILNGGANRIKGGGHMFERYISYILTTGQNWYRSIGTFHLTVDKGSAENLVSWCGEGIRKTGATTFELTIENYWPTDDLEILILEYYGG